MADFTGFSYVTIPVSDTERRMNTAARVNSLPEELVLNYELTFSPFPFRLHRDHQGN
jgi:hypothetical protein